MISSEIHLFNPLLNMRRCTLCTRIVLESRGFLGIFVRVLILKKFKLSD